jgi:hypothetical protein
MLTCQETSRLVSEGVERHLGWRERFGVRVHLWMCVHCRRFEAQVQLLREALRRRAEEEHEAITGYADLPPAAHERIRAALSARMRSPGGPD